MADEMNGNSAGDCAATKVTEALTFVTERIASRPRVGIVLGSGLGCIADAVENPVAIPYGDIPHWPRTTAQGHAGRLVLGELEGVKVVVMQGRVHHYEGYSASEVTFPIRVLGELGISTLFATNASGGVNLGYRPGDLVAVYDHINFMGINPLAGRNNEKWGPRFPDMSYAYDHEYLEMLESAAAEEKIPLRRGVYIAFSGPSFETPAEIRMARVMGADIVGMSTIPEVITANHMNVRAAAVSCVANFAAGVKPEKLRHQEVLDSMARAARSMERLLRGFLRKIS
ncbi:MAG: purine-nucleoside phosphorylase [Synergistaceae bacterium]|nr:purine-nucleoside phosphorylase [Synergistaceae bacterium]